MADPARARKLAKRISTIVATAIDTEIKDDRLEFVTITDCRVTGDLHDATLYYTVRGRTLGEEPDHEAAAAGLEKAKGRLRSLVGAGTGVRFTPTLRFEPDTVPDASRHMEELLARARAQDEAVARVAANAKPVGDADPYRIARGDADADAASGGHSADDAEVEGDDLR